jgi:hypothetical protein
VLWGPICHVDTHAKRHTHVALNTFLGRIPKPGTTVETSKLLTKGNGVLSRVLMPKRGSAAPATGASERWWAPPSDVITPPQPISAAAVAAASAVKWLHTVRRRRCSRLLALIMGVLQAVVADIVVVSARHGRVQDSAVALLGGSGPEPELLRRHWPREVPPCTRTYRAAWLAAACGASPAGGTHFRV